MNLSIKVNPKQQIMLVRVDLSIIITLKCFVTNTWSVRYYK